MSKLIRQFHRWVSMLFVLSVVATTVALARPDPIQWMAYLPLFPLALLALSGIYIFVAPYLPKRRAGA
ncbi:hypothetical protein IYY11_06000 [Methylocystis sp. H62]|uniref:hypothetical protein n=1 Tax=Methylocystis sp. H62 TaxID=2785789 RepID=UPI0018C24445|nr:hypothetical protein [Methylocystis sp. H62]MBG0792406.1 hypothetical protein [Methylocystis sp. H62]MBG0792944.1 hypothetical protein [Methylocystis sp. H62]